MASLFPQTFFGPQLKHYKGLYIVMGGYIVLIYLSTLLEVVFGYSFTYKED